MLPYTVIVPGGTPHESSDTMGSRFGSHWRGTVGGGPAGSQYMLIECVTKDIPIIYTTESALYSSKAFQNGQNTQPDVWQV